jgi:hypothetical protein
MDEALADLGAVAVGGVDQVDAELRHAAQCAQRFVAVLRLAPYTLADDAHGAEAETMHGEVAANLEGSGLGGVGGHARSPVLARRRQ